MEDFLRATLRISLHSAPALRSCYFYREFVSTEPCPAAIYKYKLHADKRLDYKFPLPHEYGALKAHLRATDDRWRCSALKTGVLKYPIKNTYVVFRKFRSRLSEAPVL